MKCKLPNGLELEGETNEILKIMMEYKEKETLTQTTPEIKYFNTSNKNGVKKRTKRSWKTSELSSLQTMMKEGKSIQYISNNLERHISSVKSKIYEIIAKNTDLKMNKTKIKENKRSNYKRFTEIEKNTIAEMYNEGKSSSKIGNVMGRSASSVSNMLSKLRLTTHDIPYKKSKNELENLSKNRRKTYINKRTKSLCEKNNYSYEKAMNQAISEWDNKHGLGNIKEEIKTPIENLLSYCVKGKEISAEDWSMVTGRVEKNFDQWVRGFVYVEADKWCKEKGIPNKFIYRNYHLIYTAKSENEIQTTQNI